ncbi:MAG: DUF4249 domain-containing protein [Saprospiraceae bacterium]
MTEISIYRKKSTLLLPILILSFFFNSCEDVIEIEIANTQSQLVVDAWLTNEDKLQTISLTQSQQYFENTTPIPVIGASVTINNNNGNSFEFLDDNNDGKYIWEPVMGEFFGSTDDEFILSIAINSELYHGVTKLKRVPIIDSLIQEFRENEIFLDDGIYVEFFARDFSGTGDAYWIRSYKNGNYLGKASELNIAYDSGFDSGSQIDGLIFIPPIREFINEIDDNNIDIPWKVGEVSRVELHSLSLEAFNFLEITRDQINNGSNGIFSIPLANTKSNITNTNANSPALGFFNIAAVSVKEIVIE